MFASARSLAALAAPLCGPDVPSPRRFGPFVWLPGFVTALGGRVEVWAPCRALALGRLVVSRDGVGRWSLSLGGPASAVADFVCC